MKIRTIAWATLLLLAGCTERSQPPSSSNVTAHQELGSIPASEVATWQSVGAAHTASGRYLQAAAFDEARKVVVMFGGITSSPNTGSIQVSQDTWEWSPATGKWTNRTLDGNKPDARSGAAMVYDSVHNKLVLFGGRAGSGYNLEDTWVWDPATGVWTDVGAGSHPSARSQAAMVFEKSTGQVLLFGGGRSNPSTSDGTGVSISLGDTWEFDPVANTWASRTVTSAPTVRNDTALVWDASRNRAVLFGGLQTDIAGVPGVPKQDTWEWDPAQATWSERTASGSRPSQRYGHAMTFDATRKKVVLWGGWDIASGYTKSDLWDWEPSTGVWTQRLSGSEAGVPAGRMYASMVSDDARARMLVLEGATLWGASGANGADGGMRNPDAGILLDMGFTPSVSREIWELDPATPTFTNRTPPLEAPGARYNFTMAFNPSSGKTILFGGSDAMYGQTLGDVWQWDGATWTELTPTGAGPTPRTYAAMAFDPVRKSMILFGGSDNYSGEMQDTWELTSAGTWAQLSPATSPEARMGHGMATDTSRNKILLFGGMSYYTTNPGGFFMTPYQNDVWEWDGASMTWTDRTPPSTSNVPAGREFPNLAFDEGSKKLFLFNSYQYGASQGSFSEWDPLTGGWATYDGGSDLDGSSSGPVAYDSLRRRVVVLSGMYTTGGAETWELDPKTQTWYVRTTATAPNQQWGNGMVFDSKRGVVVYVDISTFSNSIDSPIETWEYKVTGWGNGEGCTAATASQCASGFCVDGVCCEAAACTGACKSCNVPGSEGTCVSAKAGTQVAGSCEAGKSCDGTGSCKAQNSVACTNDSQCASGFCTDGVCCDSACTGPCVSCNQAGRVGTCTPHQAGTDPENECGQGAGVCHATCDGVGNCVFPVGNTCANCMNCDGTGSCSAYDYTCVFFPPDGGPIVYDGGPILVDAAPGSTGGTDGSPNAGGAGGHATGGAGGSFVDGGPRPTGGSGGPGPGIDGSAGARPDGGPGAGGAIGTPTGLDGSLADGATLGGSGGVTGGSGGNGAGGAGGSKPTVRLDGGALDGGANPNLHQSGCGCEVGAASRTPSWHALFITLGLAGLFAHRRRRQKRP